MHSARASSSHGNTTDKNCNLQRSPPLCSASFCIATPSSSLLSSLRFFPSIFRFFSSRFPLDSATVSHRRARRPPSPGRCSTNYGFSREKRFYEEICLTSLQGKVLHAPYERPVVVASCDALRRCSCTSRRNVLGARVYRQRRIRTSGIRSVGRARRWKNGTVGASWRAGERRARADNR